MLSEAIARILAIVSLKMWWGVSDRVGLNYTVKPSAIVQDVSSNLVPVRDEMERHKKGCLRF